MRSLYRPAACQAGVTLAEMLAVLAVLAIAAGLAVPAADPVSPALANAVATEVTSAARFARLEAIRTGAYHVLAIDTSAQSLRVYRMTTSGAVAEDTSKPVQHPVDKRDYRIAFGAAATGARIASAVFKYSSGATTSYLSFAPDGSPADVHGWQAKDVDPLKEDGLVTIQHGAASRVVRIAAVTGRVSS